MTSLRPTIAGARKLQSVWFKQDSFRDAVHSALDTIGLTETYVESLTALGEHRPRKRKAIKDSVWGMMEFDGAAMRLIDSPLLQRLRRIHQLGFTYLTYPSAEHTRFPHSLGMAHVVGRIVDSINRHPPEGEEMQEGLQGHRLLSELAPLTESDLIHAALLHDAGHLPFSHAAESAIEASRDRFSFGGLSYVNFKVRAEAHDTLQKEIQLSEALSLAVVLSPRFSRFYNDFVLERPDEDAIYRIACLIAGQRVIPTCANIQDVISSSSVDADKIDYVNRDAEACGIPIGVDVSRVFLGSGVVALTADKAEELGYTRNDRFVFALNASGWDTFDEIIRSRSTLYQRVYLHAVTRTAEALLARALQVNAELPQDGPAYQPSLSDALSLWAKSDIELIDNIVRSKADEVSALGTSLRDRILPKKACVLSMNVLRMHTPLECIRPDEFEGPQKTKARTAVRKAIGNQLTRRYTRKSTEAVDTLSFENEVREECFEIARRLEIDRSGLHPKTQLDYVVLIAISSLDERKSEAPVFQHGELLSADAFTNVRGTTDAGDHFRQIGYVLAPPDWREIALIATRTVLYRRSLQYPIKIYSPLRADDTPSPDDQTLRVRPLTLIDTAAVLRRIGLSRSKVDKLFEALEGHGYFDEFPALARPLSTADGEEVARRLRAFAGEGGYRVSGASVAAFANQFPTVLREELLAVLARATVLTRDDLQKRLKRTLVQLADSQPIGLAVAPLSASSGGAALSGLKMPRSKITVYSSLADAVAAAKPGVSIVLADDNAASGVQSSAQLLAFLGVPVADRPVEMQAESSLFEAGLDAEMRDKLRQHPVAVCVALGRPEAQVLLKETAERAGLAKFVGLTYDEEISSGPAISSELTEHLSIVGRELVAHDRFASPYNDLDLEQRAVCDKHSLGYGGLAGLTVLPTTVPTSTLTALWMPGEYSGRPWVPLLLRWGRLHNLTVA